MQSFSFAAQLFRLSPLDGHPGFGYGLLSLTMSFAHALPGSRLPVAVWCLCVSASKYFTSHGLTVFQLFHNNFQLFPGPFELSPVKLRAVDTESCNPYLLPTRPFIEKIGVL